MEFNFYSFDSLNHTYKCMDIEHDNNDGGKDDDDTLFCVILMQHSNQIKWLRMF